MTGWPANPKLVRHLKSTLTRTGVHVDEAVMGLSVHTDEDGGGDNPLLNLRTSFVSAVEAPQTPDAEGPRDHRGRRGAARWRLETHGAAAGHRGLALWLARGAPSTTPGPR